MYLWNTRALASQLRSGVLSQADRFKYFLLYTVLTIFFMEAASYIGECPSVPALTESFLLVAATVVGTCWSYSANKAGDDREFIDRYICLGIPIGVRLGVLGLITYFAYRIIGSLVFGEQFEQYTKPTNWIDVGFDVGFIALFFWRLIHHIKTVSQTQAS